MNPAERLAWRRSRSEQALRGAALLFDEGDHEGACSRAYYAMYHAASAALASIETADQAPFKTHSGLIAAFHKALVLPGIVDRESGRALSRALQLRLLADYAGEPPHEHDARIAIEQAKAFLEAVFPAIS